MNIRPATKEDFPMLRTKGITHMYGWANTEGDGAIIHFMEKQGFAIGHKYVWVDKEL